MALSHEHPRGFAQDFLRLLPPQTPEALHADAAFVLDDGSEFPVFTALIVARCPPLGARLLFARRYCRGPVRASLPKVRPVVIKALLEYLYIDRLRAPHQAMRDLAVLAEHFKLRKLSYLISRSDWFRQGGSWSASPGDRALFGHRLQSMQRPNDSFSEQMLSMLENPILADVEMRLPSGGGVLKMHKFVLASRSQHFRAAFEGAGMSESRAAVARFEAPSGSSDEDVMDFAVYLYGGDAFGVATNANLLCIADYYLLPELSKACEAKLIDQLREEISDEDRMEYREIALAYRLERLNKALDDVC
jgi:hypothetical protein